MSVFKSRDRWISGLTGHQRLIIFILVLVISALLIAFLEGGWAIGITVGLILLALIALTKPLWTPSESGNVRIAIRSLAIISSVALAVLSRAPESRPFVSRLLEHVGLKAAEANKVTPPDRALSAMVLVFALTGIFLVNWFFRDRTAMKRHTGSFDRDFPDRTYRERLQHYSEILRASLGALDTETQWDDFYAAPLDAEVEVVSQRR